MTGDDHLQSGIGQTGRRIGAAIIAAMFLGLLVIGGCWLFGVAHWGPTARHQSAHQTAPSVVPALAAIPWVNHPCHPVRANIFPASLPSYSPRMGLPWWWTNFPMRPAPKGLPANLLMQLKNSLADVRKRGLHHLAIYLRQGRWKAQNVTQQILLPDVLDAGHYRTGATMAKMMILANPASTGAVDFMLWVRADAFLAAKLPQRALNNARRLYLVCTMREVNGAVTLMAQCLASGATGSVADAQMMVAGEILADGRPAKRASACPLPRAFENTITGPTAPIAVTHPPGMAWRLNPQPYFHEAKKMYGEDFYSLLRRGNLLLLANHCRQAALVFDRAYRVARGGELPMAAASIARTIKALDKSIGRANQWVKFVRSAGDARR